MCSPLAVSVTCVRLRECLLHRVGPLASRPGSQSEAGRRHCRYSEVLPPQPPLSASLSEPEPQAGLLLSWVRAGACVHSGCGSSLLKMSEGEIGFTSPVQLGFVLLLFLFVSLRPTLPHDCGPWQGSPAVSEASGLIRW